MSNQYFYICVRLPGRCAGSCSMGGASQPTRRGGEAQPAGHSQLGTACVACLQRLVILVSRELAESVARDDAAGLAPRRRLARFHPLRRLRRLRPLVGSVGALCCRWRGGHKLDLAIRAVRTHGAALAVRARPGHDHPPPHRRRDDACRLLLGFALALAALLLTG